MKRTAVQFIKFGIIGAVNSVLTVVLYTLFKTLGCSYVASNALAWIITVIISFFLNSYFVFEKHNDPFKERIRAFIKVVASYAVTGLFLNTLLLYLWIDLLAIPEWTAAAFPFVAEWNLPFYIPDVIPPVLNIAISTPINFILNKFWAYRKGSI